jgi:hypothetical protein
MAGLLNLIPRYLPRFGMAPAWQCGLALVLVLFVINVVVTLVFQASVEAQAGLRHRRARADLVGGAGGDAGPVARGAAAGQRVLRAMTFVFAYTLVDNCVERPDGSSSGARSSSSCSW